MGNILDLLNLRGNYNCLFLRIICNLCNGLEIDLFCLDEVKKLCNFAAEIQSHLKGKNKKKMFKMHQGVFRYILSILVLLLFAMKTQAQEVSEPLDSIIKTLKLKEVVVKAKKIRQSGDTISDAASCIYQRMIKSWKICFVKCRVWR